jgi:hypothetical protein
MALLQFAPFYRMYGIRRPDQLVRPPLPVLAKLALTRDAIYHYLGVGPLDDGPTDHENVLKSVPKNMFIATVPALTRTQGNPRAIPLIVDRLARAHRVKNPKFLPMKDLEISQRDPRVPVVYNYAYLQRLYKYQRNYYASYNKWENIFATLWTTVAQVATKSDRHQFVEFDLPRILPSLSVLRSAETNITQKTASVFATLESVAILELWKWLGENRDASSMNAIRKEDYKKVNIIFRESDRWFVINLGTLNEWRGLSKKEQKEIKPEELAKMKTAVLTPETMQKRFLRVTMSLFEARNNQLDENIGTDEPDPTPGAVQNAPSNSPEVKTTVADKAPQGKVKEINPVPGTTAGGQEDTKADVTPEQPFATPGEERDDEADVDEVARDEAAEQQRERDAQITDAPTEREMQDIDNIERLEEHLDADIDRDLEELERIIDNAHPDENAAVDGTIEVVVPEAKDLESAIIEHANALADNGGLSAAEYRRYIEAAGNYKKIQAPNGKSMHEYVSIHPQDVEIKHVPQVPDHKTVADKSMLKSTHLTFDRHYVKDVMGRDVAAAVMSLQNAGILVTDYSAHDVEDITGAYTEYYVKVKPLQGTPSTLRWRMPKVDEEGSFRINGVNYRTRKQRGDLPLRKLGPDRVALTSYYGKLFAERSSKKVNDYGRWLRDKIMAMGLDQSNNVITDLIPGNCFVNEIKAPRLFTMLAMGFRAFTVNHAGMQLNFNLDHRKLRPKIMPGLPYPCGSTSDGRGLVISKEDVIYVNNGGGKLEPLPALETIMGVESTKAPVEYVELRVFGKMIPMGVILGYLLGLENLVKMLGVRPRIVPAGQRPTLNADEWSIVFEDEAWVFNRDDVVATLVLAGWRDFDSTTRTYSFHEFNRKDVYFNLLEDHGLSVRYLREMDLMNNMFIDHICKELLIEMNEPVIFTQLLIRACQLLATDDHPHELDSRFMRVKGYERFAGLLYSELVKSVRVHNAKASKSTSPLEMNPHAVWIAISEDPAKDQSLEINPIKELKEKEAVTYSGTGGRSGRSMVKRTRAFHPSDLGVISEATTDSSDVGINTFMTADPQFKSLRGTAHPYQHGAMGQTAALSTSSLVSAGADRDDMKRANFISIQAAHGVATEGNHQAQVRTGYESVIPHRVSDMYAYMAKGPGKVVSIDQFAVRIEYANGDVVGIQLGKRYGNAAGLTIPHEIVCCVKVGQEFKLGDPIAYNRGFFEQDFFDKTKIVWKSSRSVKTVLLESADTLEDSSAISQRLSDQLATNVTKVRTIVIRFDQQVHRMVKAGEEVEFDSPLCLIEDPVSASNGLLNEATIDTLRLLQAQTPQAKMKGKVDRIEVFYHGEKEDMSATLQALANKSDAVLVARQRSLNKKAFTGSVNDNFRIENDPLMLDTAAIKVYITASVAAGVGDKGVFSHQLKSVFGRVFSGEVETQSGVRIDAIFGAKSVDDRVVLSPYLVGTTASLLNTIAKRVVTAYEG